MNYLAGWVTLLMYLGFFWQRWRTWWRRLVTALARWEAPVLLLLLPVILSTLPRPHPLLLLDYLVYLAIPTILLRLASRYRRFTPLLYTLTVLAIWLPLETDLFALPFARLLARQPSDFFGALSLPDVAAGLLPQVDLPVAKLTGILLALYLFLVRQPLPGIGFDLRLRRSDLASALVGLLAFAVIGIPLGLSLRFLRFNPVLPTLPELLAMIIGGYLLVALAEELLFRGIIQNLLGRRLHPLAALAVTAVIFGASHLNNATPGFPVPNWAYMLMATLAGLAYGWVWWRTGRVTASALTHMLVNLSWGILFVT
ncbi:MAG: CPBP family intramembrane metalloprotease [Caldilineae bacterium]|nr:MAG: CPBP family intramembrane metalloprotease [Caldilineae bacterium]